MHTIAHIVKHLREFYNGRNWTASNLKDQLHGLSWQQATTKVHDFNTIAVLVFHLNYYVDTTLEVLQGKPLNANDKFAFDCPLISTQKDWDNLVSKVFTDANSFADLLEQLPETTLWKNLDDPKYGNYYRNIQGIIEHNYYHLGQIALIKKILQSEKN